MFRDLKHFLKKLETKQRQQYKVADEWRHQADLQSMLRSVNNVSVNHIDCKLVIVFLFMGYFGKVIF